jgi:hypothetical protein
MWSVTQRLEVQFERSIYQSIWLSKPEALNPQEVILRENILTQYEPNTKLVSYG